MNELTKIKWKNGAELCLAGFGATVFATTTFVAAPLTWAGVTTYSLKTNGMFPRKPAAATHHAKTRYKEEKKEARKYNWELVGEALKAAYTMPFRGFREIILHADSRAQKRIDDYVATTPEGIAAQAKKEAEEREAAEQERKNEIRFQINTRNNKLQTRLNEVGLGDLLKLIKNTSCKRGATGTQVGILYIDDNGAIKYNSWSDTVKATIPADLMEYVNEAIEMRIEEIKEQEAKKVAAKQKADAEALIFEALTSKQQQL